MAEGKYAGKDVVFLVAGYNMLVNKVQTLRHKLEAVQEPSHGLGDQWEESTPAGMMKAELAQEGAFFDTQTGYIHAHLASLVGAQDPQTTAVTAVVGFGGNAIGRIIRGIQGALKGSYEVLAEVGKLTKANAEWTVSGKSEDGVILHALGAETSDGDTESSAVDHSAEEALRHVPITSSSVANPTVITTPVPHGLTTGDSVLIAGHSGSTPDINGEEVVTVLTTTTFTVAQNVTVGGTGGTIVPCKTNAGGAGYLQVTALTLGGYTNVDIRLRDSDDDVTYADLGTFTAVAAAPTAERIEVAGAVERYLAVSYDFTGAGSGASITFLAGFARF